MILLAKQFLHDITAMQATYLGARIAVQYVAHVTAGCDYRTCTMSATYKASSAQPFDGT